MKIIYSLAGIVVTSILLTACTSTSTRSPTRTASNFIHNQKIIASAKSYYPKKNPHSVRFYTPEKPPLAPYKVIAKASVSKRNLLGIKREHKAVQHMMKQLAASIGGDGLIDIRDNHHSLEARVIAYQKILI